ncbi:hypothetical protein GCM10028803_45120 [Larkinella knui]|uniref:Lipocalin-like domain-containing protein n=1 Tax=Larkinella knui TaxID=2025310 RepID=A0A3P1CPE0_9BACT|nr:hypothetical protein [Larkinella knui]RRB15119.1 hypothetical protein EHT87_11240 [Larkinella knui]
MKKVSLFLFVFFLGLCVRSFSQTATPPDFFAGKWEIMIFGTPNGDSKLTAELVRKDGKLTGQLVNAADSTAGKIPITSIEEKGDNLSMAFTAQGYDVTIDLAKVDDDNLKGLLMNSFEAKAKRLK